MMPMLASVVNFLAQTPRWDDVPEKGGGGRMNFGDLQKGFQQWNAGDADTSTRNGLLVVVALVALVALVVHLRTRAKAAKTPDSPPKLFRELARTVGLGLPTRALLNWVARTSNVHAATLLVSEKAFVTCVAIWAEQPTFAPLRKWGQRKLERLQTALFS